MPLDKGTRTSVIIVSAPEGGYFIGDADRNMMGQPIVLFAATTLKEAQDFIQHVLEPVGPEAGTS